MPEFISKRFRLSTQALVWMTVLVGAFVLGYFSRGTTEHPHTRLYRGLEGRGLNGALIYGSFFLVTATAMGIQTIRGAREGWAYCGRTERAYRKDDPRRYRFWLRVQWGFVAFFAAAAILFYSGIMRPR